MSEFLMEAPHEEQFPMMERIVADVLPALRRGDGDSVVVDGAQTV
jgi:hypothetical protein